MDFSKIKTEDLEKGIKIFYRNDYCKACTFIKCKNCPFSVLGEPCEKEYRDNYFKLFEKELERRKKLERPKLEPGMILRLYSTGLDHDLGLYLYINDSWTMGVNGVDWQPLEMGIDILEIYKISHKGLPLTNVKSNLKLIWKKDTEKEDKIKEIQEIITKMTEDHNSNVNKLKEQIKELEGEK